MESADLAHTDDQKGPDHLSAIRPLHYLVAGGVASLKTSRTGVSRHRGQQPGVAGVAAGLAGRWAGRSRDAESPAGHHCCHCRAAPGGRGGPQLRAALIERAINEQEADRLPDAVTSVAAEDRGLSENRLRQLLTGDLATIAQKCLNPRPKDRYPSIDSLTEIGRAS